MVYTVYIAIYVGSYGICMPICEYVYVYVYTIHIAVKSHHKLYTEYSTDWTIQNKLMAVSAIHQRNDVYALCSLNLHVKVIINILQLSVLLMHIYNVFFVNKVCNLLWL